MHTCVLKLEATETHPTIKPYEEQFWATLNDVNTVPINVSLTLLHTLCIKGLLQR